MDLGSARERLKVAKVMYDRGRLSGLQRSSFRDSGKVRTAYQFSFTGALKAMDRAVLKDCGYPLPMHGGSQRGKEDENKTGPCQVFFYTTSMPIRRCDISGFMGRNCRSSLEVGAKAKCDSSQRA